jgi:1-aminocyclopropane-1-carboxylate deaminase
MSITPLVRWPHPQFEARGIKVWVKRDDLFHPYAGGNKYRKLRDWLHPELLQGKKGLLSFGGPFSNHLVATAVFARQLGLSFRAVVRGHAVDNPVLDFLRSYDAEVAFADRAAFEAMQEDNHADWLLIPMGGAGLPGLGGVAAILEELRAQCPESVTHIATAAGTGTTAAGLAGALLPEEHLLVFPAIRLADAQGWFSGVMQALGVRTVGRITVDGRAAGRGFAKYDPAMWPQLQTWQRESGILWDPIYTGKMVQGVFRLLNEGFFPAGSQIVLLHTGGWAGRAGYRFRYGLGEMEGA